MQGQMNASPRGSSAKAATTQPAGYGLRQKSGLVIAPLLILAALIFPAPAGLTVEGWRTAGIALAMAAFWISEAIPIPATALLPIVLFPIAGVAGIKDAAAPYANPLIFLFMGGFLIALAMQKWNLHLRVALGIVRVMGSGPRAIVAGFLLATSAVSMWVSNTATALMIYPIALSVIALLGREEGTADFQTALLLAVAYGSSIGGLATLIGTPPNALLAGFMSETYGYHIGFAQWMMLGLPLTLLSLPFVYWILTRWSAKVPAHGLPGAPEIIRGELAKLGRFSRGETAVASVFAITVTLWVFQPLLAKPFPFLSDTVIAMLGGLALFLVPLDWKNGVFVMDWQATREMPWDVLILFGGGLSLAAAVEKTGLAKFLGELVARMNGADILIVVAVTMVAILALTELTSNTATAAAFLPIVAALAVGMRENPLLLAVPAALASSCAFMLPVATPPNAVVFSGGRLPLIRMVKAGLWVEILFLVLIWVAMFTLGRFVFAIQPGRLPPWLPVAN